MQEDDIKLVKNWIENRTVALNDEVEAQEALHRILSRTLPELPEGWCFEVLRQEHTDGSHDYLCYIGMSDKNPSWLEEGTGKTPRQAVEAALKQIKE